jgi:hypothetical protein
MRSLIVSDIVKVKMPRLRKGKKGLLINKLSKVGLKYRLNR